VHSLGIGSFSFVQKRNSFVWFLVLCGMEAEDAVDASSGAPGELERDFGGGDSTAEESTISGKEDKKGGGASHQEKEVSSSPVAVIFLGMAGSGKTTVCQRVLSELHRRKRTMYAINLDPAVAKVPFGCNIDICDTVDYKGVMKRFDLGPNGAIMTSLNLFATKFDEVMLNVEKALPSVEYLMVDTPGQIEVFTWSASGQIVTEALASAVPTVLAYVVDTPRTTSPVTFMSNMLYACSIMYKTKLPIILVFNKTDVVSHEFAKEWMRDFEAFRDALDNHSANNDESYIEDLTRSMSLVLDQFYANIRSCGFSAATGAGVDDFFVAIEEAREEFEEFYRPEMERRKEKTKQQEEARRKAMMSVSAPASASSSSVKQ